MNIPLGINNVTCRNRADEPMTFAVFSSLAALIAGAAPNVRSTVYGVAGCDLMRTEEGGDVSGFLGFYDSLASLGDVATTALSGGKVSAIVADLGFALLAVDKSKWLFSLVAELSE